MINIYKLKEKKQNKELDKIVIYEKILSQCHKRIQVASDNLEVYTIFIVPEYTFGLPKYDVLACSDYIVNQLKLNGFNVMFQYPNFVFISWKHVEYSKEKCIQFEDTMNDKREPRKIDYKTEIQPIYYRRIEDFKK